MNELLKDLPSELIPSDLCRLSIEELKGIYKLTPSKAQRLFNVGQLLKHSDHYKQVKLPKKITSSLDASIHFDHLRHESIEKFAILLLRRDNSIIKQEIVSVGGVSACLVDPKVIFNHAVLHKASGIILAHNHPSGNQTPSQADKDLTKKVKQGGLFLEISVLDHIIMTVTGEFYSFADMGEI
jgi:DNA repair protein RadC